MQMKFFDVSMFQINDVESQLNLFLRSHKIISVEKHFYIQDGIGHWAILVEYLNAIQTSNATTQEKKPKVDYKQVLDEVTFEKFSKLREARKKLSTEDAVPAYMVFTDAELASISKLEDITPSELLKLDGIGVPRVEKYGVRICEMINVSNPEQ